MAGAKIAQISSNDDVLEETAPLITTDSEAFRTAMESAKRKSFWQSCCDAVREMLVTLVRLPLSFWLLCGLVMLIYGTIIPFNNIISEFLQVKWFDGDARLSGKVMGCVQCQHDIY